MIPNNVSLEEAKDCDFPIQMPTVTRFAPSPTGWMHLGHAYAAKVAYDLAHSSPDGKFLLRIEDIDHTRCREDFNHSIQSDLRFLAMPWDGEIIHQSERLSAYETALESLKNRSLIYPCFCTRKEIQLELASMAQAPHSHPEVHYPGTCRKLTRTAAQMRMDRGESHCWRLDCHAAVQWCGDLSFHDLRHGAQSVDPASIGDVVLSRKEIGVAYHLAVVVDDAFQNITHVTRGEDLLPSTPIHRVLQELLEFPAPVYLHHPLILDQAGRRLAKRHDSLSIRQLRGKGLGAGEILAMLPALDFPK